MTMQKCTSIYRDLLNGEFSVQQFTIGPVATTAYGEPVVISSNEFVDRIEQVVIETLDKFATQEYDKRLARRLSREAQFEFVKRHLSVSVEETQPGEILIRPLHRERGGYVGRDDDFLRISRSTITNNLRTAVEEAFRRAT